MKRLLTIAVAFASVFSMNAFAEKVEKKAKAVEKEKNLMDPQMVSRAIGHFFAKNLKESSGFHFDLKSVIKGMQEALGGKPSPLSQAEYEQAIQMILQKDIEEKAANNLNEANTFLENNTANADVIELVPGKLQMTILKEGQSDHAVEANGQPLVYYTGKYLDNTSLGSSEKEPVQLHLEQEFPGIRLGLVGAKEGEQRRLFIHPELCPSSDLTAPNSLVILDFTVVKANPSLESQDTKDAHDLLDSTIIQEDSFIQE